MSITADDSLLPRAFAEMRCLPQDGSLIGVRMQAASSIILAATEAELGSDRGDFVSPPELAIEDALTRALMKNFYASGPEEFEPALEAVFRKNTASIDAGRLERNVIRNLLFWTRPSSEAASTRRAR